MKPLLIGYDENNAPLYLDADDLETHVHGIGVSRTGKSKLIEWLARELILRRHGFCLIDPHGFLYWDLLRWLTYLQPDRDIILLDPSYENRVVGFNPFLSHPEDVRHISTRVSRRVRATCKAWGVANTDETPRLERWLRCFYHVLIELNYSVDIARYLFSWNEKQIRDFVVARVQSPLIRNEWITLSAHRRPVEFDNQIESARNRFFRFLSSEPLCTTMGLPTNNIDIEDIIESSKILLVNLQPTTIDSQDAHLIGTLLLNEIWEVGKRRQQTEHGGSPSPFFVIIDEFQQYITDDIPDMLDQAAKYGLHLFLFHQRLGQLKDKDDQIYSAVMNNARTKLVFNVQERDDARTMVERIFPGQVDLKRIKFMIEQTKFWPHYTRETVLTGTRGSGVTYGQTSGALAGQYWTPTYDCHGRRKFPQKGRSKNPHPVRR